MYLSISTLAFIFICSRITFIYIQYIYICLYNIYSYVYLCSYYNIIAKAYLAGLHCPRHSHAKTLVARVAMDGETH